MKSQKHDYLTVNTLVFTIAGIWFISVVGHAAGLASLPLFIFVKFDQVHLPEK